MTFEEWWEDSVYPFTHEDCAKEAWEAGFNEGLKCALKQDSNTLNKLQLTLEEE